jgi:NADH-quinone oxidoreductase subunit N
MWLLVAAVLDSVISVYYYLRIVAAMYFRQPAGDLKSYPSLATGAVLVVLAVAVLGLGIAPMPALTLLP